jgi:hypothetical protein
MIAAHRGDRFRRAQRARIRWRICKHSRPAAVVMVKGRVPVRHPPETGETMCGSTKSGQNSSYDTRLADAAEISRRGHQAQVMADRVERLRRRDCGPSSCRYDARGSTPCCAGRLRLHQARSRCGRRPTKMVARISNQPTSASQRTSATVVAEPTRSFFCIVWPRMHRRVGGRLWCSFRGRPTRSELESWGEA